jgi:glutamine cyclotransferase
MILNQDSTRTLPRRFTYRIIETFPHDHNAFTQGLVVRDSILYEGTGHYGESSLRKVLLNTGEVLKLVDLESKYFGEGLTVLGDRLIQLTWKSKVGFVYDKESFEQTGSFSYPTLGWGITHDGERLIMSTGSSTLYFRDPETFEETGRLNVTDNLTPVTSLNELEYVEGEIFANVWQTDRIAIISPESGQVTGWLDLTGLIPAGEQLGSGAVLNGIAYDDDEKRLFVTGKLWPYLFEIELIAVE